MCALTRTISLSYRGISVSFLLGTKVFQKRAISVSHAISIERQFFPHILNGQLTRLNTVIGTWATYSFP